MEELEEVTGKIYLLSNEYENGKFVKSLINLHLDNHTSGGGYFYGYVPKSLAGKRVTINQTYYPDIKKLVQKISVNKNKDNFYEIKATQEGIERHFVDNFK